MCLCHQAARPRTDLSQLPDPSAAQREEARSAIDAGRDGTPEEAETLARWGAFVGQACDRRDPICVGPVIIHEDGAVECYGCTNPLERSHISGTSAQCRPGRTVGHGHMCARCTHPPP